MTAAPEALSTALADRYRIERQLGAGGMATVYLAHDVRHDRKVALKVLRPELSAILGAERFLAEIKTTANLQHPHILGLFDSGEAAGLVYYVMPFVEGESLRDRLDREQQLPIDEAIRLARNVADALQHAHERGVVHRDIKPENILLHGGHAVVADFGIAFAASRSDGGSRMTETGMSLGTPHYMSPEQAMGEREVTPKADIYALACVLYEMLIGEPPFTGANAQAIIARVLTEEPRSLTAQRRTIPHHVEVAVQMALAKVPADRFASAKEFSAALGNTTLAAPSQIKAKTTPWPWVLAAGVLAVSLVASLWALWRARPVDLPLIQSAILPPEKGAFSNLAQAISPDGRQLVFTAEKAGEPSALWVRSLDSLEPRLLPGTENAAVPFWSPDSRSIGFYSNGKLRTIDATGGPVKVLVNVTALLGATWGPDGTIVYVPNYNSSLFKIPATGGEATALPYRAGGTSPAFLPDGRHFLFSGGSAMSEGPGTYLGSLDSPEVTLISPSSGARFVAPGYLLFRKSGNLMAQPFDLSRFSVSGNASVVADSVAGFSVSSNGVLVTSVRRGVDRGRLTWVDRAGREVAEAAPPGQYGNFALSGDGKRILYNDNDGDLSIKQRDLERGIVSAFYLKRGNFPIWSPDGKMAVFAMAMTEGKLNLGQRPSDMSDAASVVLKLDADPLLIASDWSADGRYVAYFRTDAKTQLDQWVLPLFGDRKPIPFLKGDFNESQGQFSPDGKWMAYVSDESGLPQVNVVSFPNPKGIRQISVAGGRQPRWRRDGKELFFVSLDQRLMAVNVTTGDTFDAEAPRPLFAATIRSTSSFQAFAVSPDGQRFLLNAPSGDVTLQHILIQNWIGAVKK